MPEPPAQPVFQFFGAFMQPGNVPQVGFEAEAPPHGFQLQVNLETRQARDILVMCAHPLLERTGHPRHRVGRLKPCRGALRPVCSEGEWLID